VLTQAPVAGASVAVGTTTVTITATDAAGNQAQKTVSFTVTGSNRAPTISLAALDMTIRVGQSASLAATVTDDNLPAGSKVTQTWAKVFGPGAVTFGSPTAAATLVSMSETGTYVLCLTASDGALSTYYYVTVTVVPRLVPQKPVNLRIVQQ